MKNRFFVIWILAPIFLFAQEKVGVDSKYFEDQFYVGIQYNNLLNKTNDLENNGVPYSFNLGFIKDIPLNKQRNIAFGLGFGYSYDVLRPSVSVVENNNGFDFEINKDFNNYRYSSHSLEFPMEFRWRTSTASKYSFWRIYTGGSFVYNFSNKVKLDVQSSNLSFSDLEALNKTNYTIYTSIGHGVLNFHIKYYLKPFFKETESTIDNKKISFNQLKIGVMFYIL